MERIADTAMENIMTNPLSKKRRVRNIPTITELGGEDRRVKIPKEDHDYIRERVKRGEGIRALAREYGVDKRLIQFIVDPEKLALNRELRKARGGWKRYYDKDKHTAYMKKHRAHLADIIIKADESKN